MKIFRVTYQLCQEVNYIEQQNMNKLTPFDSKRASFFQR